MIDDSLLSCRELCAISVVPRVLQGSVILVVLMVMAAVVLQTLWRKRVHTRPSDALAGIKTAARKAAWPRSRR